MPTPSEQDEIERQIRAVIAGRQMSTAVIHRIAARLQRAGADKIVLGCTELSVLMAHDAQSDFTDPLQLIATKLLETSKEMLVTK